mgnify:FL=1|tara:strand:+ start:37 stop:1110 length:1074 start_codon:yes stop_codon:yes gene_type:complete
MKYDFLIIGGGIAGISLGGRLAPNGSVCVLETEDLIGYHASGRSAAMFLENYGNDIVVELNKASTPYHKKGGYLTDRGLMSLGRSQDKDSFLAEINAMNLEQISIREALDLFPIINTKSVEYVSFLKQAPDLDTDKILQDFAKMIRRNNGIIKTKTNVNNIKKLAKSWQVETNKESFEGTVLINAAGAWVDEVALMANVQPLDFVPMRRSIARVPSPTADSIGKWPMVHGAGDRWYAKPDAGAWLISPCEEDPMHPHDAFADDMVLAEGIDRYSKMVNHEITSLQTSWAGLRTFSQDHALVIGFDKSTRDFFWFAGQGGYGFQTAPAASQLASELILSNSTSLAKGTVKALSPKRFD